MKGTKSVVTLSQVGEGLVGSRAIIDTFWHVVFF